MKNFIDLNETENHEIKKTKLKSQPVIVEEDVGLTLPKLILSEKLIVTKKIDEEEIELVLPKLILSEKLDEEEICVIDGDASDFYGDREKDGCFKLENLFSELVNEYERAIARQNLGIGDAQTLNWGNIKGNILNQADLKDYIFKSPQFVGMPTAPTQSITNSSSAIATTEWVVNYVSQNGGGGGSTLGTLDNVDESADNIDESDTLLIKEADKDIWVSKNINDVTVSIDDFNKLLNKFNNKFPFKITSFSGGGNFKKGNTINITFRWAYDGDLDSQSFVNNGVTELLDINARSITVNNITTDSNYTLNANNVTATQYVRFYNPRYYGVINTIPTQDNFSTLGLSENISSSRGFTYSGINLNKQRICYAYPKSFGALTSVLDGSNLENLSVYTKDEFTINGELYYVYYSDIGNVSNFKQTYK